MPIIAQCNTNSSNHKCTISTVLYTKLEVLVNCWTVLQCKVEFTHFLSELLPTGSVAGGTRSVSSTGSVAAMLLVHKIELTPW